MPVCTERRIAGLPAGMGAVLVMFCGWYAENCSGAVVPVPGPVEAMSVGLVMRTVLPLAASMLMGLAVVSGGPAAAAGGGRHGQRQAIMHGKTCTVTQHNRIH